LNAERLPAGLAERVDGKTGKRWKVVKGAGLVHLVTQYAAPASDAVRFLELGKLPGGVEPSVTVAFRHVKERFRRPGWVVVADLTAGTRQAMFGWACFATVRIAVVEPSAASILTARRLLPVATHLVVNKMQSETDLEVVTQAITLPLLGVIPYDDDLAEAERRGMAPIDVAPQSRAAQATATWSADWKRYHEGRGYRQGRHGQDRCLRVIAQVGRGSTRRAAAAQ